MREIILIKHSAPQVDPKVPAHLWSLSEEGRQRCQLLADKLRSHNISAILASEEPKALQTAQLLAQHLGMTAAAVTGLQEQDRRNVPQMETRDFVSAIALLFQRPNQKVLGRETANEARRRFETTLGQCLAEHPQGNIAVVSHGTVIALFLEARSGLHGFQLWRQMGLPSFVVLSAPEMTVLESVETLAE